MLGMELVQRCDVFRLWIGGRVCPLQHRERFPRPADPLLRRVAHQLRLTLRRAAESSSSRRPGMPYRGGGAQYSITYGDAGAVTKTG